MTSLESLISGFSPWEFAAATFFGLYGWVYFRAGRRESDVVRLVSGIALMTYTVAVKEMLWIVLIGGCFIILPLIVRRYL